MRACHTSAIFQWFMSPLVGVENPKPASEGTTTSKASAGSPPCAAGSARGSMTLL